MLAKNPPVLAAILSFFLAAGCGILLFGRMSNAGFGTGFIAAAILLFLYAVLQLRKAEHAGLARPGRTIMVAGRAAYSTLALFSVAACLLVIGAAAVNTQISLDLFKTLGAAAGVQFLLFVWLFAFYHRHLQEHDDA